ncbi:PD-(D/E)XK nuclease-like domain-containing protein [Nocardia ignorata]|uniref:PD-(D/E)XK nuclease-like domain-containing protein n=1 Tax=Nocardia ignorata TaxID=145285 RepID=UPI0036459E47
MPVNDICPTSDLDREVCPHCNAIPLWSAAPTKPGLYPDVPEVVYHGDSDSLSSTGVRELVKPGGPAHHRFGEREESDAFDIGTAAHTLLLGMGAGIEEVAADTWQSKAAKDSRAAARKAGKIPLLTKQAAATRTMVDAARARPEVAELLAEGDPEMSAYALDPASWVMLRARFDWLRIGPDKHVTVVDYKTTKNAAPKPFVKSAVEYGYHVQEAHYRRVLTELGYVVDRFVFLAQEKAAPYLTCLHEFDTEAIAVGDRVVTAGIEIFDQCRRSGDWPGYGDRTYRMSLPSWAIGEW